MDTYKAFVLEDDKQLRNLLNSSLGKLGFEVTTFEDAETLLESMAHVSVRGMPDVIYTDLQLKPDKMQGLDAIVRLVDQNVPSEILVVSGNHPSVDLVSAIMLGATLGEPKPFNIFALAERMQRLAEIGRKRKAYWMAEAADPPAEDGSRESRPAFLSCSASDQSLGNGLRRNLESRGVGVWYSATTPTPDNPWSLRIEEGIDHARVFIALLTDEYVATPSCMAEITHFFHRGRIEPGAKLLLIPVLGEISKASLDHPVIQEILQEWPFFDLSSGFMDAMTALLVRIHLELNAPVVPLGTLSAVPPAASPASRSSGSDAARTG